MKLAVVTGVHEGIGLACCTRLSKLGYQIVGIDSVSVDKMHKSLTGAGVKIEMLIGDLPIQDNGEIAKSLEVLKGLKSWSVLVNALASNLGEGIYESRLDDWNTMINVNLTLPYQLSQLFALSCKENNVAGSIVNVSSMVGLIGAKKPGYASSRSGIFGLTKSLAMQLGPNVRCNLVYTGAVNDLMHSDWDSEKRRKVSNATPMGRLAEPEDIARIITFLADNEESSFITGATINATGGQYLGQ